MSPNKARRGERFEVIYHEGTMVPATQILLDKLTGVQYLVHCPLAGAASMSILVDANGNPLLYRQ